MPEKDPHHPKITHMNPQFNEFQGKVAVITGGGGVLCSTMAMALAQQGAKVAILDLRIENAQKVVEEIHAQGG